MKKEVIVLFLLGILLVSPLVLAQEQSQTYSGFNRFVDNVKLFFSSGDNKVNLALEIREKEVNSALGNLNNNDEATEYLERARNKLLLVQEKVSANNAEKVKSNVNEIKERLNEYENLPDEFETYVLEEEKTQLAAELVVEVDGKEGQTLTREIVKDEITGQNVVRIVVEGDNGEQKVIEIEGKIIQIENQIAERVVKIDMAEKKDITQMEKQVDVQIVKENEDVTPPPNIVDDDVAPGSQGIVGVAEKQEGGYAPGTHDTGDSSGDTIDDTYDDVVNGGDCGDGVDCGDGSAEPGVEGVQEEPTPAVDSNEGDTDAGITGEVIASEKRESFLGRFFKWVFRK